MREIRHLKARVAAITVPALAAAPSQVQADQCEDLVATITMRDLLQTFVLIENGADLQCQINDGVTPLMRAAESGNTEVLHELLRRKVAVDQQRRDGQTALIVAAGAGRVGSVEQLLEAGANIDQQGRSGLTALMEASKSGQDEVVQLLLDKRANIERQNLLGDTALTLAAQDGNEEVVRAPIAAGADVDHRRRDGDTALSLAGLSGQSAIAVILVTSNRPRTGVSSVSTRTTCARAIIALNAGAYIELRFPPV